MFTLSRCDDMTGFGGTLLDELASIQYMQQRIHLYTILRPKKLPQTPHDSPKRPIAPRLHKPLFNPPGQLTLNPRHPIPPIQQHNTRIIPAMPNRPPNTLIHGPHTRILVELPSSSFPLLFRSPFPLDILQFRFPLRALQVWEGETDDDYAAPEVVGEVYPLGHFAADDGEQEAAFVGFDARGVGLEDVGGAGIFFGFHEYGFVFGDLGPDAFGAWRGVFPAEENVV